MTTNYLGWAGIVRLGLVQTALGAIVVLTTSTLNRVMVVELGLAASLPAALVGWHYGVQLSRPYWGHGSDVGRRRTPWIIAGMGVLALGGVLAANATILMGTSLWLGVALAIVAFTLVGAGVGASGTSLLAMLAVTVAPERRPAAASITWIMMIVGIVLTANLAGANLDPFSEQRLALVASAVAGGAFLLTLLAVMGVEDRVAPGAVSGPSSAAAARAPRKASAFRAAINEIWAEPLARAFTIFVFASMLAYSAQDLILEPFAGLVFGYSVGESTKLSGMQHSGVLLGMILVGASGVVIRTNKTAWLRRGAVFGCAASAFALVGLAQAGFHAGSWPLQPTVFALGFANGVFAVSAVGMMMSFAGEGAEAREGVRMGLWGASQAVAFGLGGFAGAAGLDAMRAVAPSDPSAFSVVFGCEAVLFVVAAALAARLGGARARDSMPSAATPVRS